MKRTRERNKGFGLIELLIGLTIIGTVLSAAFVISNRSLKLRRLSTENVQAALLLSEGAEALRLIRDSGWATTSALTLGTSYALGWDGSMWVPTVSAGLIDDLYDRRFVLSAIRRDADHRIVASGGVVDPDGKEVTLSVSWRTQHGATTTKSTSFYLFNLFD